MTRTATDFLLRWLPPATRAGVVRRGLVVLGVAPLIALFLWISSPRVHQLDRSLVYTFAISTSIWLLCDPVRIALHRWLQARRSVTPTPATPPGSFSASRPSASGGSGCLRWV